MQMLKIRRSNCQNLVVLMQMPISKNYFKKIIMKNIKVIDIGHELIIDIYLKCLFFEIASGSYS
jgi:hypothetical protein